MMGRREEAEYESELLPCTGSGSPNLDRADPQKSLMIFLSAPLLPSSVKALPRRLPRPPADDAFRPRMQSKPADLT